ncbi:MAG: 50S ribosome-binding GTPase [Hormoscilla sp. GM7CHS1pb]|nr:50S ribosome-binding GTPase [Hormoscilla sp. GM7CHS1pb]
MVEKSLSQLRNTLDERLRKQGITPSDQPFETLNLAMVGATSVGKSKTINALIGHDVCKVGHVGNTTRKAGWNDVKLTESVQPDFWLLDLPGWGVSRSVDADYKFILRDNLPEAHAVFWIMKADALGTLAYDLEWISEVVIPNVKHGVSSLVLGINQVENVFDYSMCSTGKPSEKQLEIIEEKCALIHDEIGMHVGELEVWRIQPYSASKGYRLWSHALVSAADSYGWVLQLISALKAEESNQG